MLWIHQNNRVLRFPRPVAQSDRITPDAVIGQFDFVSSTSAAVNATSLKNPAGLAIGPNGDFVRRRFGQQPGAGVASRRWKRSQCNSRVWAAEHVFPPLKPAGFQPQTLTAPQRRSR